MKKFRKRSRWRRFAKKLVSLFSCIRPGARFSKVTKTFRARKAIRKTTTYSFCKAGLLICCKGNKNKNNWKVSWLETPWFWRYKENYVTWNTPEKFRDFREAGPWLQVGYSIEVAVMVTFRFRLLVWKETLWKIIIFRRENPHKT